MSKRNSIAIILILCLLVCVLVAAAAARQAKPAVMTGNGIEKRTNKGIDYYIFREAYSGEYDIQYKSASFESSDLEGIDVCEQMDYARYQAYCEQYGLTQTYTDPDRYYLVYSQSKFAAPEVNAELAAVEYRKDTAALYIFNEFSGVTGDVSAYVCVVPTDVAVKKVQRITLYSDEQYASIMDYGIPDASAPEAP